MVLLGDIVQIKMLLVIMANIKLLNKGLTTNHLYFYLAVPKNLNVL